MVLYEPTRPKRNPYFSYSKKGIAKVIRILEDNGYIFKSSKEKKQNEA